MCVFVCACLCVCVYVHMCVCVCVCVSVVGWWVGEGCAGRTKLKSSARGNRKL